MSAHITCFFNQWESKVIYSVFEYPCILFTIVYLQWHIYTFPTRCTYFKFSSVHKSKVNVLTEPFPICCTLARTKVWSCNCIIWMSGKYNPAVPLVRIAFCCVSDSRYFGGAGEGGHRAWAYVCMCAHMNHMSSATGLMFCWDCEAHSEKLQHLNSFQQVVFAHRIHRVSGVSLSFSVPGSNNLPKSSSYMPIIVAVTPLVACHLHFVF